MNKNNEEEFNIALGRRLMMLRLGRKMSLDALGARLGVRGQQVHKYEIGENRMPPKRIKLCAEIFGVSADFFLGMTTENQIYDQNIMVVAAEVDKLPSDNVKKGAYNFIRTINEELMRKTDNDNAPDTPE